MEYKIIGEPLSVVICELDSDEAVLTERDSMCWMSPNMEALSGEEKLGKVLERILGGEPAAPSRYIAQGGPGEIAFAASSFATIHALEITPDQPVVVQQSSLLACESGVQSSVLFQRKLGGRLFGGEEMVMQKLAGHGTAFVEIGENAGEYWLGEGQSMPVDADDLAMMDATCTVDLVAVPGVKGALFGGEGEWSTVVHGPGRVVLQGASREGCARKLCAVGK